LTSWRSLREEFSPSVSYEVELHSNYTVSAGGFANVGIWTLVYDTGLEISYADNAKMFAFFDYYPG
jgi:hypothetical protein